MNLGVIGATTFRFDGVDTRLQVEGVALFPGYTQVGDHAACFDVGTQPPWPCDLAKERDRLAALTLDTAGDAARLLLRILERTGGAGARVLAIGCATGRLNAHVRLAGLDRECFGCDIDGPAIAVANALHGDAVANALHGDAVANALHGDRFRVQEDPHRLPFADGVFDVAVFEGSLSYIKDTDAMLAEADRVCRGHLVAHYTSIVHDRDDVYCHKTHQGYDGVIPEIHFNEARLIERFVRRGFALLSVDTVNSRALKGGITSYQKSYLFRRM